MGRSSTAAGGGFPQSGAGDEAYDRLIPDLRPGERVVLVRRRHPFTLFTRLTGPVLMLGLWVGALFAGMWMMGSDRAGYGMIGRQDVPPWAPTALLVGWIVVAAMLALWLAYVALGWMDHWIALTTRRVIVMERVLLFRETRREAPVLKVQNVTAEYPSLLGTGLDYGNVKIDTAGAGVLEFHGVPRPRTMRDAIFAQQTALASVQPTPEERRQEALRALVLGQPDPNDPNDPQSAIGNPQSAIHWVWRRHWLYLVRGLSLPVLTYAALAAAWVLSPGWRGQAGAAGSELATALGWALVPLLVVCLAWGWWNWEDWRNDRYGLDHERVYRVESLPLGMREQSQETLIGRVTDVSYVIPGVLANLLDFGDVLVKTPGEGADILFHGIPHPREVQQEIMVRVDEHRLEESASVDHEIEGWIRAYHDVTRVKGNWTGS